jgi:hypothetical protein
MLYGARDMHLEERPDPTILKPIKAILKISAACTPDSTATVNRKYRKKELL